MTTATIDKPAPRAATNELVDLLSTRRREVVEAAHAILTARAENDEGTIGDVDARHVRRLFSEEELAVFDLLGWDRDKLNRELHKAAAVSDNQRRAGTSADRQAAAERLVKADEALATNTIDAKIVKLQQQKAALQNEQREAAAVVKRQADALESLRKLAPAHVREQHDQARAAAKREFMDEGGGELGQRVNRIRMLLKADRDRALLFVRTLPPAERVTLLTDEGQRVHPEHWAAYVAEQAADLPELEQQLATLEETKRQALADADKLLDVYAR